MEAKVAYRFSSAKYLVIIDLETGDYEAVPNPAGRSQPGAGVQAIILAASKGAKAVLTGYANPAVAGQFRSSGIDVLSGITGTVADAVAHYHQTVHTPVSDTGAQSAAPLLNGSILVQALRGAARQFINLLPVLAGVVLLMGLFNAFVSKAWLTSVFSENAVLDTILGACFGSILAGNPINSYIIGGELLDYGVSLFAVTAFIVTWVTVGIAQLPAEIAAFGKRFALLRNGFSFLLAIPLAILTVVITNALAGGLS